MEKSSRKELTQRAMAYHNLVTQLQREQILRRNIITSHAEERRRLLGHEHLQYHTRVLAWTAKAHSHGQQKERWKKFAGQHLNPFTHTPDSLHRYLRSIGVLRDAYAYNLSSSSSKQQWATTIHKIPTAEPGDGQNNPSDCSKVDAQQAQEQSEMALIHTLLGTCQMEDDPSAYTSLLDDSHDIMRSEATSQVRHMWEQSYTLDPLEKGVPKDWLGFSETLEMHHMFYLAACYEMASLLEKQRLFHFSALIIPRSQNESEVDLR